MQNSIPKTMAENNNSDFLIRVKKFRIKIFWIFLGFFLPSFIMKFLDPYVKDLLGSSVSTVIFVIVFLIGMAAFQMFLGMKCPKCGEGYFTKYDYMPRLMYKLKCQNCDLNVFARVRECDKNNSC